MCVFAILASIASGYQQAILETHLSLYLYTLFYILFFISVQLLSGAVRDESSFTSFGSKTYKGDDDKGDDVKGDDELRSVLIKRVCNRSGKLIIMRSFPVIFQPFPSVNERRPLLWMELEILGLAVLVDIDHNLCCLRTSVRTYAFRFTFKLTRI